MDRKITALFRVSISPITHRFSHSDIGSGVTGRGCMGGKEEIIDTTDAEIFSA